MSWYYQNHTAAVALIIRGNSLTRLIQESVRASREVQCELPLCLSVNSIDSEYIRGEIRYCNFQELAWELCDFMNDILALAHCSCALIIDLNPLQLLEERNLIEYEGALLLISWKKVENIKTEIKAVTYSEASLKNRGFFWEWQICVDV